ncbi:hypothetical protein BV98_001522 [Sphingobium herbicidovorans NBRC 16415]|uniref:Uncharacterized protein n=1 Tax=Sphingobium herbicidovorans (strain ATCC 700291 / DSM 11019 / CCUG 56400 / KCTC 2939 / LMG 18315 / NBRC 16415 / MH) TaxID=1219045 RepID=A0A086PAA2_SPHHM|nr:hypothetical protein [Sphingobium herbicidovorans]KFG90320.1 hypothetical protein BV98_001522 [Sphingobium herbicidovorans NBRC 16415]
MPTTADSSAPVTSALAAMLHPGDEGAFHAAIAPAADPRQAVEAWINAGLPQGAPALQVRSLELHLVRAFNTADLGSGPETVVVGEPEFLYVADVGLAARAGLLLAWANGIGAGVPTFPEFANAKLRTIVDTQPRNLIFPLIAGEWIGSIRAGTDPQAAKAAIEGLAAYDVTISGTFVEGKCHPFMEAEICAQLEAGLDFLRYAEPNRVVRLVDFSPGWDARRLC